MGHLRPNGALAECPLLPVAEIAAVGDGTLTAYAAISPAPFPTRFPTELVSTGRKMTAYIRLATDQKCRDFRS